VMDNPDGFHGSFYLHKDLTDNAKWIAGPIWDLVCYNREKTDYTFRMKVHYGFTPHWIGEIIQYDSFCKTVSTIWEDVYPDKLNEIFDYVDSVIIPLGPAWQNDCKRWNEDPSQTAELRATRIKAALLRNIEWFNNHLPVSENASQYPINMDKQPVSVFNLQGQCLGTYNNRSEATSILKKGIYIVNGTKIKIQ
ncbi:MAG: CotH kinase family protein, partial [Muribaculaceae bacterium]|nr:CotH kinase family protein [Muribaculaceae bacterium]